MQDAFFSVSLKPCGMNPDTGSFGETENNRLPCGITAHERSPTTVKMKIGQWITLTLIIIIEYN
jgi:hypothetical protein